MDDMIDTIMLKEAMDRLDEIERAVITKRYIDEVNQSDLADYMCMNRASLSRIEKRAIMKLKHFMK